MKTNSIVFLIALFFISPSHAIADPADYESTCPIAEVVLSGNWGKLEPGFVENEHGMRYLEARKSTHQETAILILTNEAHGWSVEYQDEDHGSLMIRERLPLKTKDQVKACARFFTDSQAAKDLLDVE
jgi:hypothetical protein